MVEIPIIRMKYLIKQETQCMNKIMAKMKREMRKGSIFYDLLNKHTEEAKAMLSRLYHAVDKIKVK